MRTQTQAKRKTLSRKPKAHIVAPASPLSNMVGKWYLNQTLGYYGRVLGEPTFGLLEISLAAAFAKYIENGSKQ